MTHEFWMNATDCRLFLDMPAHDLRDVINPIKESDIHRLIPPASSCRGCKNKSNSFFYVGKHDELIMT